MFVHEGSGPERQEAAERASAALVRSLAEPTAEGIALRVDTTLRPGGARGALLVVARRDARVLRDAGRDVGAPGADQGPARRGRTRARDARSWTPSPRSCSPRCSPSRRSTRSAASRSVSRSTCAPRARPASRSSAVAAASATSSSRSSSCRSSTAGGTSACASRTRCAPSRSSPTRGTWVATTRPRSAGAYRFLRTLEHRLQIVRDLQTHELPADPAARTVLARSLGMRRRGRAARRVRTADHAGPGGPRAASSTGRCSSRSPGPRRLGPAGTGRRRSSCWGRSGSTRPAAAYEVLARLVEPSTHLGKVLGARVPRHGAGARARVRTRCGARPARAGGRGDGGRRDARRRARERHADGGAARPRRGGELVRDRSARGASRADARAAGGRRDRRRPGRARVGGGAVRRRESSSRTRPARSSRRSRIGSSRDAVEAAEPDLPFAVIGLGKLGAQELNFASDLDVVFVYEGEGPKSSGAAPSWPNGSSPGSATPGGSRTPTCGPRGGAARSRSRSRPTSSTGSATRRRGSSSRCCGRGSSRATRGSGAGSARSRATSRTPSTCPSTAWARSAGCASGSSGSGSVRPRRRGSTSSSGTGRSPTCSSPWSCR